MGKLRAWFHGWVVFKDIYFQQRRKKRGAGKQQMWRALRISSMARFIAYGQNYWSVEKIILFGPPPHGGEVDD